MKDSIADRLTEYYRRQDIHPESFNCRHQAFCRQFAHLGQMTETKMSLLGSRYGQEYPRIVVLSLDPPLGEAGIFARPERRTTAYITTVTEADDFSRHRPNVHWAMTQIIVADILRLFGHPPVAGAAVVVESYANRPIENVTPYFAHVNAAKCSMNHPDKGQASQEVHRICSRSYLLQELSILQPEILVSQGRSANIIVGRLFGVQAFNNALPQAYRWQMGAGSTLWLPMDHPARNTGKIRERWPFYLQAIQDWQEDRCEGPSKASGEARPAQAGNAPAPEPSTGNVPAEAYRLYKCRACGKLVLGFDREGHAREVHHGEKPGYKKVQKGVPG